MKPLIVPIDLGGSPHGCAVMPPAGPPPSAALVKAMVGHYTDERRQPDQPVQVAFFRGGLPDDALLDAAAPHPVRLSCNPADLRPDHLNHLWDRGVRTLEIEALSLSSAVLRPLGRRLSGSTIQKLIAGIKDRGFTVGVHLWPGLPGSSHDQVMADLAWLLGDGRPRVDFLRVLPAGGLEGTDLAAWAQSGRWVPMTLGEAVTTVVAMLDACDGVGVPVVRVGLQPRQDLGVHAVAGPAHPNLRALAEGRRFLRRMRAVVALAPRTRRTVLRVHPADLSWAKGQANSNLRTLRAELQLAELAVVPDETLPRGVVRPQASDGGDAGTTGGQVLPEDGAVG